MPAIIQVNNVQAIVIDQNIAGVKVSMQSKFTKCTGALEAMFDAIQNEFGSALVGIPVLLRNKVMIE